MSEIMEGVFPKRRSTERGGKSEKTRLKDIYKWDKEMNETRKEAEEFKTDVENGW